MIGRKRLIPLIFISCLLSSLLVSCGKENPERIILNDSLYWFETDAHSSVWTAMTVFDRYQKLNDTKNRNLERLLGNHTTYVWIKSEFTVPESLQGMSLAMEIPYVHFAAEVYVNGILIGRAGRFPPREASAFYKAQYYDIANELINQYGRNTVYIKVFCMGKSTLGGTIFIGEPEDVEDYASLVTFVRSTIYVFFEGFLSTAFIFFLMLFISKRENKEYLVFALMNLFTMFFLFVFFSGSIPVFELFDKVGISYTMFVKLLLCINMYVMFYMYVYIIYFFLKVKEHPVSQAIRAFLLVVFSVVTLLLPGHEVLQRSTPIMLSFCFMNAVYAIRQIVLAIISLKKRYYGVLAAATMIPILFSAFIDIVLRYIVKTVYFPYFSVIGWICVIMMFLAFLASRFNRASIQNEYLNQKLRDEVALQTKNLNIANENLAKEIVRANQDLEMASIVQKKYFPYPEKNFRGWNLAIDYTPLTSVSGDLYDYYSEENSLTGFAIFDVSGHGLSASLITMLAKNIIASSFRKGKKSGEKISDTLVSINNKIIGEKGNVENYLTGILAKFSEFDENDSCEVSMANAGHPHPVLFRKSTGKAERVLHDKNEKQFGAIGIQGIGVSFPTIKFKMEPGDILVCFTDGLSEVENEKKEQFGYENIEKVICENSGKSATEILESLLTACEDFSNSVPFEDDRTVIVLKRNDSSSFVEFLEVDIEELEEI